MANNPITSLFAGINQITLQDARGRILNEAFR